MMLESDSTTSHPITSDSSATPTSVPHFKSVSNRRYPCLLAFLLIGVAAGLRLVSAIGDLALDEIWTLWFVKFRIQNIADIFTLRHDNNHLLNTIVMYALRPDHPGIVYRLPAVVASTIAVWVSGKIAMRQGGFQAAIVAWIFVGTSYLLTLYGSEARGYAYVVCLAYLAWLFLLRTEEYGKPWDAFGFAITASLGFLSHLTFLYCYAGFCIWSLRKFQARRSWVLVVAHVLPVTTAASLYLFFIRGMEIGGGPDVNITAAIASTLSISAGGPLSGSGCFTVAAVVIVVLSLAFFRLCRVDRALAAGSLTTMILMPAFVLLKTRHAEIYPRYFLVPIAFGLLILSDFLVAAWQSGGFRKILVVTIIGSYVTGNLWWTERSWGNGRGDYSGAIAWIAAQNDGQHATVCTDHDFRNQKIFDYYTQRTWPTGSPLEYVELANRSEIGTDWMILHNFVGETPYPDHLKDPFGNSYTLQKIYRHDSLTGWNWWVYRKVDHEQPFEPAAESPKQ